MATQRRPESNAAPAKRHCRFEHDLVPKHKCEGVIRQSRGSLQGARSQNTSQVIRNRLAGADRAKATEIGRLGIGRASAC